MSQRTNYQTKLFYLLAETRSFLSLDTLVKFSSGLRTLLPEDIVSVAAEGLTCPLSSSFSPSLSSSSSNLLWAGDTLKNLDLKHFFAFSSLLLRYLNSNSLSISLSLLFKKSFAVSLTFCLPSSVSACFPFCLALF